MCQSLYNIQSSQWIPATVPFRVFAGMTEIQLFCCRSSIKRSRRNKENEVKDSRESLLTATQAAQETKWQDRRVTIHGRFAMDSLTQEVCHENSYRNYFT